MSSHYYTVWPDDHWRIVATALERLPVYCASPVPQAFADGVIEGVNAACYEWNLLHHDYPRDSIKLQLAEAKALFRKGDYWNAGFIAGRAIHYLHDRCFGGLAVMQRHKEIEGYFANVPVYPEYADYGVMDSEDSFEELEKVIKHAEKTTFHHSIMKKALYITAFVLGSIVRIEHKDKKSLRAKLALRGMAFVGWLIFAGLITLWAISIVKNAKTEYDYTALSALLVWLPVKGAFARFWAFKKWYRL